MSQDNDDDDNADFLDQLAKYAERRAIEEGPLGVIAVDPEPMSEEVMAQYAHRHRLSQLAERFVCCVVTQTGKIEKDYVVQAFDVAKEFLKELNERTGT